MCVHERGVRMGDGEILRKRKKERNREREREKERECFFLISCIQGG